MRHKKALASSFPPLNDHMNAISRQTSYKIDWVINYLEVNSKPASTNDFCRLRITNSELRLDPAGIVLAIGQSTSDGIELQCELDSYLGTIVQRGNEIVVRIRSTCGSDSMVIVAKKSVSAFELPHGLVGTCAVAEGSAALALNTETRSLF